MNTVNGRSESWGASNNFTRVPLSFLYIFVHFYFNTDEGLRRRTLHKRNENMSTYVNQVLFIRLRFQPSWIFVYT